MLKTTSSYEEISLMKTDQSGWSKFVGEKWKLLLLAVLIALALSLIIAFGVIFSMKDKDKHPCADTAARIIEAALSDSSLAYSRLGYMCHTFGNRLSGSPTLESALGWMLEEMVKDNLSNAHAEEVWVPTWVRGHEYCNMISPFVRTLSILGLGGSVGTNSVEMTGKVIVVTSYDDLQNKSHLVSGNIVLYNVPFVTYGTTVRYRSTGAIEAAKYGAKAALVRSITPFSLYTPHTGATNYNLTAADAIPFAAVTVEDAEWMQFMYDSGENITLALYMEGHYLNDSKSSNVMAEITGSEFPNKVVVIGGHTDSWDVGQGAMDDGGGVLVSWEAVRLLHSLGLVPKRTIRVVGWVNEENGLRGGTAYAEVHKNETHILAIESDEGATLPLGIQISAPQDAIDSVGAITALLKSISADGIQAGGGGADIGPLGAYGVPLSNIWTDTSKYFWYHHTNADTFDKMDDLEMRKCVATMAVVSFCVADAEDDLPRNA